MNLAFFSSKRSVRNRKYYECHRSGSNRKSNDVTQLKWSESIKVGKTCPARIVTTNIDVHIHANYQKTRVGHTKTIRFLHLTKEEREKLAGKTKLKIPFKDILNDIRVKTANTLC